MQHVATESGTRERAARARAEGAPEAAYRRLGRSGLVVSAVGFGSYRVDERTQHADALSYALRSGCNLVDTSTNYTDGASERTVGRVVRELVDRGAASRSELVLVSKVGYVQGGNLDLVQAREREGRPYPEVVRYGEGCWHCIHPEFIHDQLDLSLERLGLPALDVYLLHNPEYFLSDARAHGDRRSLRDLREEFYRRIKAAFGALEDEVARGRIAAYGVSSNTFVSPADDPEATSVSRMHELARRVAAERGGGPDAHHFSVVQLPFNLLEPGAFVERSCGPDERLSALECAQAADLGVLANRPLNAFSGGRLIRLADFAVRENGLDPEVAARAVVELEDEFRARIAPALDDSANSGANGERLLDWGRELPAVAERFSGVEHWSQVEHEFMRPRLEHVLAHVGLHLIGRARNDWAGWRERYLPAIEALLSAVGERYRRRAQRESERLARRLQPHVPAELRDESLSRKAIGIAANARGVTSVLVGMRKGGYVDDALGVLKWPPFPVTEALFRDAFG